MRFSLLFIVVHCFLMGLCIDGSCWSGGPLGLVGLLVWWALGLVGPWVWWARGSGEFCWVLTDKSPTLRGPTCQGVLCLVFHRFPGTPIRPHYMPVKRAECFPFRDFFYVNFMLAKDL